MMQQPHVSQGALDSPVDGSEPSFWMPVQAAEGVKDVDFAFNFILAICTFFFVLIVGLGILFVIKYRKRPGYVPKPAPHHSLKLEITWSVIPIILCVFMFWFGFTGYMHGRTMPEDANQINVVAAKWSWDFQYPNGASDSVLHLPVGEPTVVTMRSKDVLHSFFIPAFPSQARCGAGSLFQALVHAHDRRGIPTVLHRVLRNRSFRNGGSGASAL